MKGYCYSRPVYEAVVKRKDMAHPTPLDIRYTKELFAGFDIHEEIGNFKTKNDLYNWRDKVIRSAFND